MKTLALLVSAVILGNAAVALAAESPAPYAGWQAREIKALSAQQVEDLKAGRGMGLALAAELNGYPGPRHVLDLGDALELTASQRAAFDDLFRTMQADAQRLGAAVLAEEAALDAAFRSGRVDEAGLGERLARLGALQGELRAVHLRAHLTGRALLTPAQLARYQVLRGYAAGGAVSAPDHAGPGHAGHGDPGHGDPGHGHAPARP